jgi:pimeloyl-ACP methyl ester carboxylesterase/UDP-N-acetylglucosamine:LPS N-acetylglucosamine transferase
MRAIQPATSGQLDVHGFRIGYETFGEPGGRAFLLLPTWQIIHGRHWKMQVPLLARHGYVISYDVPGNGLAERTEEDAAFEYDRIVDQGVALLDHLGVEQVDVLGLSRGCAYALWLAARYPERARRLVLIGNGVTPETKPTPAPEFWKPRASYEGWEKWNYHFWLAHYRDWLEFFFGEMFSEPHSTKGIDDCVTWGLETTPEILSCTVANPALAPRLPAAEAIARVQCPVLILHGDDDRITPIESSQKLVEARPDFEFVTLEGSGHGPHVRDPVRVNLLLEEFLDLEKPKHHSWRRAMSRRQPRVLFISSPIGLGHVQRDLAIARELCQRVPGLQIEWLAQHPVTRVLAEAGETIHPLSYQLVSESAHWEQSADAHGLHCFYAWREMDEILLANFMIFLDAVRGSAYDLWIGDEAWEVDYYLHENPELKTAPFVFLTDFLGWLPIDRSSGSREAFLTADYNAEMIEQVARYPRIRDRALYVGNFDDIVSQRFGPRLPLIREWAEENFTAIGDYIVAFDPAEYADTRAVRERLGYDPAQPLVFYAVGGTAVGKALLHKACAAWPLIQRERADARCIVVAGPRIDPTTLPQHQGLEVRSYVHNLYEHLAVADLAVVQGGLSTTMELTVSRRPFLYFPIHNHCEQVYHVTHRLDRYRAGLRLDYAACDVEALAECALEQLGADTRHYRAHNSGAAARAAQLIAELL